MSGSNQIFLNQTERYHKQNGLAVLNCTTETLEVAPAIELGWDNEIIENNNIVEVSAPGSIVALKTGIYSFQIVLSMQSVVNVDTVDFEPNVLVYYKNRRHTPLLVGSFLERLVARGNVNQGAAVRRISLSFTTFMEEGEYIYILGQSASDFGIEIINGTMYINSWY